MLCNNIVLIIFSVVNAANDKIWLVYNITLNVHNPKCSIENLTDFSLNPVPTGSRTTAKLSVNCSGRIE